MSKSYTPSEQVNRMIEMIIDHRYANASRWDDALGRRFHDGNRHGLNLALRALVELETKITDPEDLDELCAELIAEALINRC